MDTVSGSVPTEIGWGRFLSCSSWHLRPSPSLPPLPAHIGIVSTRLPTGAFVVAGSVNAASFRPVTPVFGAVAIGMEGDLGSIRSGKFADLAMLDGNPLENIRNAKRIRFVVKNGRVYEEETLDEVWLPQREPARLTSRSRSKPSPRSNIHP